MRRIVQQNFPIQRIEFCGRGLLDPWFIDVVAENPDYFSRIPSLVYNGPTRIFSELASVCLVENLTTLNIPEPISPEWVPRFSSKLRDMTIGGYHNSMFKHILNLKSLELFHCQLHQDTQQVALPDTIEELICVQTEGEQLWRMVTPSLKKLTLNGLKINLKEFRFPEGLVELGICFIDFSKFSGEDIKLPSTLKKLILRVGSLGSLRSIEFPSWLESLTLETFHWQPMEPFTFPHTLRALTLQVHNVDDLVVVCEKLPLTLEYLDIRNIECPTLPQELKVLKFMTLDRLSQFPPNLEQLQFSFQNDYCNENMYDDKLSFQLPSTLRYLGLYCRIYCRFEMNLNLLNFEHMELYKSCGPVPPLVKSIVFHPRSATRFDDFVAPYGVRKLHTVYTLIMSLI